MDNTKELLKEVAKLESRNKDLTRALDEHKEEAKSIEKLIISNKGRIARLRETAMEIMFGPPRNNA